MLLLAWLAKLLEESFAVAGVSLASNSAGSAGALPPPGMFSKPTPVVPDVQAESSKSGWVHVVPSEGSEGTFAVTLDGVVISWLVVVELGPIPYETSVACSGYGTYEDVTVLSGLAIDSEPPL